MQKEYKKLTEDFVCLLRNKFQGDLISVILFGSVARNTAKKESDIDLLIVAKNLPSSLFQRMKLVSPIIAGLKEMPSYKDMRKENYFPDISPILFTPEEIRETKPIFLDIADEGEFLLDDGTLRTKLDELKNRMKSLNSKKVFLDDGTWYWMLKPGMKLGEVINL